MIVHFLDKEQKEAEEEEYRRRKKIKSASPRNSLGLGYSSYFSVPTGEEGSTKNHSCVENK